MASFSRASASSASMRASRSDTVRWKAKAGAAPRKKAKSRGKLVEGAWQKVNGKWANTHIFPGREFDDLDAYRAAKKQRAARRAEWRAQA